MGSRKQNFYNQLAQRMGYEAEAAEIQDKYLSGDKQGAGAAVPHDLIDRTTLLGSVDRIADRMKASRRRRRHHADPRARGLHPGRAARRAPRRHGGPGAGRTRVGSQVRR